MNIKDKTFWELELGDGKRKCFFRVYIDPVEIWVDIHHLGTAVFLCAVHDGTSIMEATCGENNRIRRIFVNIEWMINDWGGAKELVDALKKRKQMIMDDIENITKRIQEYDNAT